MCVCAPFQSTCGRKVVEKGTDEDGEDGGAKEESKSDDDGPPKKKVKLDSEGGGDVDGDCGDEETGGDHSLVGVDDGDRTDG